MSNSIYAPKRAMVIVAHPDDIEFGCAGTVARWVRAWREDPAIGDAKALAGDEFEPAAIEKLWRDHLDGRADNGLRLFGLVAFRAWARRAGLG